MNDDDDDVQRKEGVVEGSWILSASLDRVPMVSTMIGLLLAPLAAKLDMAILETAIPYMTDDFGTVQGVSWYAAAAMLISVPFQAA